MNSKTVIRLLRRSDAAIALHNISNQHGETYIKANFRQKFIEPFRVAIAALISHPVVTLVGNRAQLLCNVMNGGLLGRFAIDQSLNGDVGNIKFGVAASVAALLVTTAFCGANTANLYARTRRRIEGKGKGSEELSEAYLKKSTDSYCTTQGVYLATRGTPQADQLNDFLKKNCPLQNRVIG